MIRPGLPSAIGVNNSPTAVTIAKAHPLAQGLQFCLPLTEGAGRPRELVRGEYASVVPTWTNTVWGQGIIASSSVIGFTRSWYPLSPPMSVFALIDRPNPVGAGDSYGQVIGFRQPPAGGILVGLRWDQYAAGKVIGYTKSTVVDVAGTTKSPTVPFAFGMALTGTNAVGYVNATRETITNASAYATNGDGSQWVRVGTVGGTTSFAFSVVYAWNRQLTDAEFALLRQSPYCFLVPG